MHWYLAVLKQYAVFEGRARRGEYWNFVLFNMIAAIVLAALDAIIAKTTGLTVNVLGTLYGLAVLVPSVAVTVRRLHDTNRSGWWVLLALVPLVGLVLIVFLVQESETAPNRFGRNPKLAMA